MTATQRKEIVKISKQFCEPFYENLGIGLNESGWLIVDPLSGFLNACGYTNTLGQLPETDKNPLILVMTFSDGDQLIPCGEDLKNIVHDATNWQWV